LFYGYLLFQSYQSHVKKPEIIAKIFYFGLEFFAVSRQLSHSQVFLQYRPKSMVHPLKEINFLTQHIIFKMKISSEQQFHYLEAQKRPELQIWPH